MNQPLRAVREQPGGISPIWLVPIVAGLIGLWMGWHTWATRGDLVQIQMQTAEGIEPGKTLVKTRDVSVGKVVDVQLSDELDYTIVSVRMNPATQRMLRTDTRFWVVRPRIGREGISGLGTVLSGAYIRLQPGHAKDTTDEFTALEKPPSAPPGARGLRLTLIGDQATALSAGDAVEFQGFNVGQVESAEFDVASRKLVSRLFIRAPFDRLVTSNTRFWSTSGLHVRLDASGVSVGMSSLEALLGGGVSFGVPRGLNRGDAVEADTQFTLYADADAARQGTFDRFLAYVLLIDDSVRGLNAGAPVEYRGVRVGTVAQVPYRFTTDAAISMAQAPIPVLIHIEPQRLEGQNSKIDDSAWRARFAELFGSGLRASLSSANLLTGALLVDLDFYPDAVATTHRSFHDVEVFPSTAGGFAQLEQKLARLLDKLNGLEVEPVLARMDSGLGRAEQVLTQLQSVTTNLDKLLADPATQDMPSQLQGTLGELRSSLQGVGPDSGLYRNLGQTLQRLDQLMRDLQPLLRTLDEKPNALIFDRGQHADPQPRAPDHAP